MSLWQLSQSEQCLYRLVYHFFFTRLRSRHAVEWAVRLKPTQHAERQAILELIGNDDTVTKPGPWLQAWTMIEESWDNDGFGSDRGSELARVKKRIDRGERSSALARKIARLVEPCIHVGPLVDDTGTSLNYNRRVTSYKCMMLASLKCEGLLDQDFLPRDNLFFIKSLVIELDTVVERGIERCRQLDWPEDEPFGHLSRVYNINTSSNEELGASNSLDDTLAPAVKLLHAATTWLITLDKDAALPVIDKWQSSGASVYIRLWAAIELDHAIASDETVGNRLLRINDRVFWNQDLYPEICELRTQRFASMKAKQRHLLLKRLKKGPPRALWSTTFLAGEFKAIKRRWSVREFRRIEQQGGALSNQCSEWLARELRDFPEFTNPELLNPELSNPELIASELTDSELPKPEIPQPELLNSELPNPESLNSELPNPEVPNSEVPNSELSNPESLNPALINTTVDNGHVPDAGLLSDAPTEDDIVVYDDLDGAVRLQALETSLIARGKGQRSDSLPIGNSWLQSPRNRSSVFDVLSQPDVTANNYPLTIGHICRLFTPLEIDSVVLTEFEQKNEFNRFLRILAALSEETIGGITDDAITWVFEWKKYFVIANPFLSLWHKLWEAKVSKSDSDYDKTIADSEIAIQPLHNEQGSADLNVYCSPLGQLVSVFVAVSRAEHRQYTIFVEGSPTRKMRDKIESTFVTENSIARRVLIHSLPYLYKADQHWAETNLINPLFDDSSHALDLWGELNGRRYSRDILNILGEGMINRSTDLRLNTTVRKSFLFNIVMEILYSEMNKREPAVSTIQVQQALRVADNELRTFAADTLWRFVHDLSKDKENNSLVAAELFREAIAPFLTHIWPQETSLVSLSTSKALAKIPGVSGDAFSHAVAHVERYLRPFPCASLSEYRLSINKDAIKSVSTMTNRESFLALLTLLDVTIDQSDDALVPHDLSDALEIISAAVSDADSIQSFARLSSLVPQR